MGPCLLEVVDTVPEVVVLLVMLLEERGLAATVSELHVPALDREVDWQIDGEGALVDLLVVVVDVIAAVVEAVVVTRLCQNDIIPSIHCQLYSLKVIMVEVVAMRIMAVMVVVLDPVVLLEAGNHISTLTSPKSIRASTYPSSS